MYAAIHITLDDSKVRDVNVVPAGDAITVGAVVPNASVPPVSGEKYPLVSEFSCATDTIPAGAVFVVTKSPPSGEMAMPRPDPVAASAPGTAAVTDVPYGTTRTAENPDVQKMEPFTEMAERTSAAGANSVVVSSTPLASTLSIVYLLAAEVVPAPAGTA